MPKLRYDVQVSALCPTTPTITLRVLCARVAQTLQELPKLLLIKSNQLATLTTLMTTLPLCCMQEYVQTLLGMRSLQVIMTQLALQHEAEDSTTDMLCARVCPTLLEISRLHMITDQLVLSTKLMIAPLMCYSLELPRLYRRYPCTRT